MAILTDTKARNLKPDDKPLPHGGVTGLALHPSPTKGRGKWVLRYVSPVTQKRRNAGLGSYPEISIADAAKAARVMREQLANGHDPLDLREQEQNKPVIPTVELAARQVYESLLPAWKNPKHGKQWIATLEQYAFPVIGQLSIDTITPAHIAEVLQPIWLEIPETASRVKQRLHAVMAWAWAHGYCTANPVDVVSHLLPSQPSKSVRVEHQPAMPWREIPAFVKEHLRTTHRFDVTPTMLEFLILTACRSGEVRAMKWSEVDWEQKIWSLPAERMKAKQLHRVPLAPRAIALLENMRGLHSELVFPPRELKFRYRIPHSPCFCVEPKLPVPPKAGMPPLMVFVPAFGTGAVNRGMPETWLSGPWPIRYRIRLKQPITVLTCWISDAL